MTPARRTATDSPAVGDLLDMSATVVVVTGASGGIGAGLARRFHAAGARVIVHGFSSGARSDELSAELGDDRTSAYTGDLRDEQTTFDLAAAAVERFGRLDVWVNNAGVQPVAPLDDIDAAAFSAVVDGNLLCCANGTRAAAAAMGDGGAIVNIASIEALHPAGGHSHYSAAKAAIVAHTSAAALELGGRGIRVNAVAPGLIERPGLAAEWPEGVERWQATCPLGRLGQPDDVADACLFLASPAARWISGAVLAVDGGMLTAPIW